MGVAKIIFEMEDGGRRVLRPSTDPPFFDKDTGILFQRQDNAPGRGDKGSGSAEAMWQEYVIRWTNRKVESK